MSKKLVILLVIAVVATAIYVARTCMRRGDTGDTRGATQRQEAASAAANTAAAAPAPGSTAKAEQAAPLTAAPGSNRVRIPRPSALPPRPSLPPSPAPIATDEPGVKDKRGPGAKPIAKAQEIFDRLDQIEDDVAECIAEWRKVDPTVNTRAMLAFQIDANGLQDVWLAEHAAGLPVGPASCFSSAVYAIDWSGLTESPIELTQPFVSKDAPAEGHGRND